MSLRIRRGGAGGTPPPPPPPPPNVFGPTDGPQWVRDHATPQPITVPPTAIEFVSEADLISKVASNASNTSFKSLPGANYAWTSTFQETTKSPNIYWLPGAIIDGQNNSASGITGFTSEPGSTGFQMYGGEFKNFWRVFSMNGNCILEDAVIHDCYEKGFNLGGNNNRVTRTVVSACGRYGFNANTGSGYGTGNVIEFVQAYGNLTRALDPRVDAGCSKLLNQDGLIVRYCWIHDNNGAGLWWDGNNRNVQVYENVCETNLLWGIFYELGFGGTNIYNNACFNNAATTSDFGTGQILSSGCDATITGSPSYIDIYNNWVDGTTQVEIGVMNHSGHGLSKGTHYHDNDVWHRGQVFRRMAGVCSTNGTIPLTDDNTFENNHYHVHPNWVNAQQFLFGDNQNDPADGQTFAQWQAAGRDDTGTLVSV